MRCSFIQLKLKDKSNINKTNKKFFELFRLSFDNNIINLIYSFISIKR